MGDQCSEIRPTPRHYDVTALSSLHGGLVLHKRETGDAKEWR